MKSQCTAFLAVLSLVTTTGPAQPDNLRATYTTTAQNWTGGAAQRVRLTTSGALDYAFTNPQLGYVAVTYTAVCSLNGHLTSWLAITVIIDGSIVPPSGQYARFCSGQGLNYGGFSERHSITVTKYLSAGLHSVRINAQALGEHVGALLDDTTLLIAR